MVGYDSNYEYPGTRGTSVVLALYSATLRCSISCDE